MLELLTACSPITGFEYYTDRRGDAYILYVKLAGHHVRGIVSQQAFREIPVGVLYENLRLRGVKGVPVRLDPIPVNGFLPIARFDGRQNPATPNLRQLC